MATFMSPVYLKRYKYRGTISSRIPDLAWVIFGAHVIECSIDHLLHVIFRAPAKQELCLGIIQPRGVIACLDLHSRQSTSLGKISSHLAVIDGFIHADVEELSPRLGMIQGKQDCTDQIVHVDKVPFNGSSLRVQH